MSATSTESNVACMIDLETLALSLDTTILRAAWVFFDFNEPFNSEHIAVKDHRLDWISQGRKINTATLYWHLTQSSDVIRDNFSTGVGMSMMALKDVLYKLKNDFEFYKPKTVWSKGVDFDIKILEHAYDSYTISPPWTYRQPRCFRTFEALLTEVIAPDLTGQGEHVTKHTAEADAMHQAYTLYLGMNVLKGRLGIGNKKLRAFDRDNV